MAVRFSVDRNDKSSVNRKYDYNSVRRNICSNITKTMKTIITIISIVIITLTYRVTGIFSNSIRSSSFVRIGLRP